MSNDQNPGCGFASLPAELIADIIAFLSLSDIAQLLRVNSLLHEACIKAIYTQTQDVFESDNLFERNHTHARPPLDNAKYAQHVRCLDVRARPQACCNLPPFSLPNLDVLRLRFDTEFLECNRGCLIPESVSTDVYKPKMLMIHTPTSFYGDAFPINYVAEKIKTAELVLVVKCSAGCDMAVSKSTPVTARSVTIIIHVGSLQETFPAIQNLCTRLANLSCYPFYGHRLQHVRFVLAGIDLTSRCYDQLLISLQEHIRKCTHYKGDDAPGADATQAALFAGPLAGDLQEDAEPVSNLPPPAIEVCSLYDYCLLKSGQLVLSWEDIADHCDLAPDNELDDPKSIKDFIESYSYAGPARNTELPRAEDIQGLLALHMGQLVFGL